MTLSTLDATAVADARDRGGGPREDRPEEAEKALNVEDARVGFQNGTPLLERDYGSYPTGQEILRPSARDALEAVATHDRVGDVSDIGNELRANESTVQTALDLHGIDPPTDGGSFDTVAADEIAVPLHGTVQMDHLRTPLYDDARLLGHLYITIGYGVGEIREYLEFEMNRGRDPTKAPWSVREAEVRDALEAVGLLDGRDPEPRTAENDDVRLGGPTLDYSDSRDTLIHADDYE
jgi:hypothetical protein